MPGRGDRTGKEPRHACFVSQIRLSLLGRKVDFFSKNETQHLQENCGDEKDGAGGGMRIEIAREKTKLPR